MYIAKFLILVDSIFFLNLIQFIIDKSYSSKKISFQVRKKERRKERMKEKRGSLGDSDQSDTKQPVGLVEA